MRRVKELVVDIGGKKYLLASDDEYLEHIKNSFEPAMVALFKLLASKSEIILDVGANIGCSTLLFGELSKSVHAFEPSASTFAFLKKNIANSGRKNIVAHNIGLGEEPKLTTLTFAPANRSGGFVSDQIKTNADYTTETINIKTLDDIVAEQAIQNIDFIKIDVEGFEGHVLRGGKKSLLANKPIVVLELNHWCLNAFQRTSVPDFFDFLRSVFPILLAVDRSYYLDLNSEEESYTVMYEHIVNSRFNNIVAGFEEEKFIQFREQYEHGFLAESVSPSLVHKLRVGLGRFIARS